MIPADLHYPVAMDKEKQFTGLLIGQAVGDAIGLPAEGLSRQRVNRMFRGRWKHRFFFTRGMVSDDTDHAVFVSQSLLACPDSAHRFGKRLSLCLMGWLLSLPAGVGMATARAVIRLFFGFGYKKSGVFSAGNGPAMRAGMIGLFFANDMDALATYTRVSTRITHTDPKALVGATAIASLCAWIGRNPGKTRVPRKQLRTLLFSADPDRNDPVWQSRVETLMDALESGMEVEVFADALGLSRGVTGYIHDTVPVCIFAWQRHPDDYRKMMESVCNCGGDTDTTGAIAGALSGASLGEESIPENWRNSVWDWPRGMDFYRRLGAKLSVHSDTREKTEPVFWFVPGIYIRNLFFLGIVLFHGFRRLFPPYY